MKPLFIVGPGMLLAITMIASERQPKLGEPEHTEQNRTQQESDRLEADALLDALTVSTSTATGTLGIGPSRYLGPKDFR
jgi:hypothetical protein